MITDKQGHRVEPKKGMKLKLAYSKRTFTIKEINDKFLIANNRTMFPIGLEFKLVYN